MTLRVLRVLLISLIAAGISACGTSSSPPVPRAQMRAFRTQYFPASLPGVTAEYTLATAEATPRGIVVEPDGSVLAAEEYGHALAGITPQGTVSETPIAAYPAEMTVDSGGHPWFTEPLLGVTVVEVQANDKLMRYIVPSVEGTQPFPTGIAAQPAPSTNVWFTEPGTNMIGTIDAAGTISTFDAAGTPIGIAVGSDNALYFTELNGDAIGRMDFSGNLTNQYAVPTKNNLPSGISSGPNGTLWFTETGCLVKGPAECVYGKIGELSGGAITEFDAQSDPVSIALGGDGNLWFTARFANKIGRITPAGVVTLYPVPTLNSEPFDIVKGPNRTLWFTERAAGKIGVLSY